MSQLYQYTVQQPQQFKEYDHKSLLSIGTAVQIKLYCVYKHSVTGAILNEHPLLLLDRYSITGGTVVTGVCILTSSLSMH